MCSENESPMPSHRKCKNITKVFPYNLENMIYIVSKRRKLDSIKKQYPNAIICDVTSTSPNSLVKLSPFYPHMNIPIPFSPNYTGASVEGIWQGLKVFVGEDIDNFMLGVVFMNFIDYTVTTSNNHTSLYTKSAMS